jgi:hypothetical protein
MGKRRGEQWQLDRVLRWFELLDIACGWCFNVCGTIGGYDHAARWWRSVRKTAVQSKGEHSGMSSIKAHGSVTT